MLQIIAKMKNVNSNILLGKILKIPPPRIKTSR
jgi:hypothetical protein